jgi:phage FluMu protein Com
MIEILKEGKIPHRPELILKKKCGNCKTVFRFTLQDTITYRISGKYLSYNILCPLCKDDIYYTNFSSNFP